MFEIIIKETSEVVKTCGKEWDVVGTKEEERKAEYYGMDKTLGKTRIVDEYGYTPEIEKKVAVEREIYRQKVSDIDIWNVIKAINKSWPPTKQED